MPEMKCKECSGVTVEGVEVCDACQFAAGVGADSRGVGRPTLYKEEYVKLVYDYCLLGATDAEIAGFFDIAESTLNDWKHRRPEFYDSMSQGKEKADMEVAEKLFQRAKGYSHPEDKIFNNDGEALIVPTTKHYPPDVTAIKFWMTNRQPKNWRDKQDHEHSGEVKITRVENVIIDPANPGS